MPSPSEIWLANFPYTEGTSSKIRPVVVLWVDHDDSVVSIVTTSAARTLTDIGLADWADSGLSRPSVVRLMRLGSVQNQLLMGRLGSVSARDASALNEARAQHIRLAL